jgi:hypothetical protein
VSRSAQLGVLCSVGVVISATDSRRFRLGGGDSSSDDMDSASSSYERSGTGEEWGAGDSWRGVGERLGGGGVYVSWMGEMGRMRGTA